MATLPGANCPICKELDAEELIELDMLMGDPTRWPDNVFDPFEPPKGDLRPSYRRHGAMNAGIGWLSVRGYATRFTSTDVRRHYAYHTPKVAASMTELIANGLIATNPSARTLAKRQEEITLDPNAYLQLYAKGIEVGIQGLLLIQDRVEKMMKEGKEVPMPILKMMVEQGSKLSISQAAIRASGKGFGDQDDADDSFRTSQPSGQASPRMGHHRIRQVEGETRPIKDEGPADRKAYSTRAAHDGSEGLPHP